MSDKPQFGIGSSVEETEITDNENQFEVHTDTPNFGASATIQDAKAKKAPVVGTSATQGNRQNSLQRFFKIFALQDARFWVVNYLFSAIGLFLVWSSGLHTLAVIDFILYPITVTLLGEIGHTVNSNSVFFAFIMGAAFSSNSFLVIAIVFIFKFVLFFFKFIFSIFLGPIGLLYMMHVTKKMNL